MPSKIKRSFVPNGVWKAVKSVSFIGCCDCGLVHRVEYRSKKGKIEERVFRDDVLTKQVRRQFKHSLVQEKQ